jgi:hypothetical protein
MAYDTFYQTCYFLLIGSMKKQDNAAFNLAVHRDAPKGGA